MPTLLDHGKATPASFAPFGWVVQSPTGFPTASDTTFSYWSDLANYHVEGATEIGICTVHVAAPPRVTWMERHDRTPEVLIPIDASFLLPVMDDHGAIRIFQVDPGEAVVIGEGVWHSACIPLGAPEATYFVIFRRGTPKQDVIKRDVDPVTVAVGAS